MGNRATHPAGLARRVEDRRRITLPGTPTAAFERICGGGVGSHREQQAGAILQDHTCGSQTTGRGKAEFRVSVGRDRKSDGGVMKIWKRLRLWTKRGEFERDLAEEVRFHREMAGAAFEIGRAHV